METAGIREQLHQYIDKGDEKFLRLMYAFPPLLVARPTKIEA